MTSTEIKKKIEEIENTHPGVNLRPSDMDRETVRSQKQLTLAVLEVALQLSGIGSTLSGIRTSIVFK